MNVPTVGQVVQFHSDPSSPPTPATVTEVTNPATLEVTLGFTHDDGEAWSIDRVKPAAAGSLYFWAEA